MYIRHFALNGIDIEVILRIIVHGGSDGSSGGRLRCGRRLLLLQRFLLGSIVILDLKWKIWNVRY